MRVTSTAEVTSLSKIYEIVFAVLTNAFAFAVGISALVKKDASTHAITEMTVLVSTFTHKYLSQFFQNLYTFMGVVKYFREKRLQNEI